MRFALPFHIFPQALHWRPAANDDAAPSPAACDTAPRAMPADFAIAPDIDAPEWNLCGRWLAYYLWMP